MIAKILEPGDLVEYVDGDTVTTAVVSRVTSAHAFVFLDGKEFKLRREYHCLLDAEMLLVCPGALCSRTKYWRVNEQHRESSEPAPNTNTPKELLQKLEELQHYKDKTAGLWAIDRDPSEVDIDWIRKNAFKLK